MWSVSAVRSTSDQLCRFQLLDFFCGEPTAFAALEHSDMVQVIRCAAGLGRMILEGHAALTANEIRVK